MNLELNYYIKMFSKSPELLVVTYSYNPSPLEMKARRLRLQRQLCFIVSLRLDCMRSCLKNGTRVCEMV